MPNKNVKICKLGSSFKKNNLVCLKKKKSVYSHTWKENHFSVCIGDSIVYFLVTQEMKLLIYL